MDTTDDGTLLERLALPLSELQTLQLGRLHRWLATEAVEAGGLGPNEVDQITQRHIGDSAAFACQVPKAPDSLIDLGSGVGLPGAVLAILWPRTSVTLLDRSGRRADLARRMTRVVGLD